MDNETAEMTREQLIAEVEAQRRQLRADADERAALAQALAARTANRAHAPKDLLPALAALRANEARQRALLDVLTQLVWTTDPAGSLASESPAWAKFTGQSAEELRNDGWLGAVHPDDRAHTRESWRAAITGRDPYQSEYRLRRSDGSYPSVRVHGVPVLDDAGGVSEWVSAAIDVTEQRRAHAALELLADTGGAMLATLDGPTALASITRLALPRLADWCAIYLRRVNGTAAQLVVGHVVPGRAELVRALLGDSVTGITLPFGSDRALDGETVHLPEVSDAMLEAGAAVDGSSALLRELNPRSWMVLPLIVHKQVLGVLVLAASESGRRYDTQDVELAQTFAQRVAHSLDHVRLFDTAKHELARAEDANRAKDEFLATVSHELRTPLNAVLGWTRMLRVGNLPEDKRPGALEAVERNARALTQLVEDLVDVSRIAARRLRLHARAVVLLDIVQAALDAVRLEAERKGVRLQPVLDPDAGPIVGDADRLLQVVCSFLNNAIEATPPGGRVQVRLQRNASHVEIAVADTGRGIRAEELSTVFDGVRPASEREGARRDYLGFGLPIARHLVELHGGTVHAFSEGAGKGATFLARLPLAPAAGHGADARAVHPVVSDRGIAFECPPQLAGLRVLVVDDDADARDLLVAVLGSCRAQVSAVATSREALEAIKRAPPDVLVSDIGMPSEDGYAFIRRVRALPREQGGGVPALALTAYARVADRTRAMLAGFQMHLPKPIDPAELVVVIANLAGRIATS